jgi:cytochrome oxidase Cu insertion factor (SCO1/SenC/PrrC family)
MKGFSSLLLLLAIGLSSLAFYAPVVAQAETRKNSYVCPMDADVKATKPGKCPKCGMALRRATSETLAAAAEPANPDAPRATGETSLNLARLPDTTVIDQHGTRLRFYNDLVKGKTVAINFIFTTCTTICPPLAATFRKVQQELGERVGREVSLISITIDPATDVPERLNAFASKFNAAPGWSFITGIPSEMKGLLKVLGAAVADKNDHTPMVLVGNEAAGYWTRAYGLASPQTLVKVITDALAKTGEAEASVQVPLPGGSSSAELERQVEKRLNAGVASDTGATAPGTESRAARTPMEKAAAYFPNTVLLTQDNKPVRFFDDLLKGKTVMINFMFTTCTGICPPMTANLSKVQAYLGERVGKDISMISISVDPIVDTPAALKKYATNYKVKDGWYFLTGSKADVDLVLSKVGGLVRDKSEHNSLVMIGKVETGEWLKVFAMTPPSEIADKVLKVAGSKKE